MEKGTPSAAYVEALDYLYSLINFERQRLDRYAESKLDPERPYHLVNFLGAPQNRFPAIHIAGTKGKGSVAAMCAYSLHAAGLRVGLYTSPHLQEFRERIRILTPDDPDGRISEPAFVDLVAEIKTALDHVADVTWFEAVTAIALAHFAQEQVDVAVIETGLGGRLDATRVVNPLVSVITSLSLDHTELLGNTLAEIAYEKAGIIKPGIPVISAQQAPEAAQRLQEIAAARGSSIDFVGRAAHPDHEPTWLYAGIPSGNGQRQQMVLLRTPDAAFAPPEAPFTLALDGDHQLENAAVDCGGAARHPFALPDGRRNGRAHRPGDRQLARSPGNHPSRRRPHSHPAGRLRPQPRLCRPPLPRPHPRLHLPPASCSSSARRPTKTSPTCWPNSSPWPTASSPPAPTTPAPPRLRIWRIGWRRRAARPLPAHPSAKR
jgi:hypothetical protein